MGHTPRGVAVSLLAPAFCLHAGEKKHDDAKGKSGHCTHSSDCNSPFERWVGECVDGKCVCTSGRYAVFDTSTSDAPNSSTVQKACVLPGALSSSRKVVAGAVGDSGTRLPRTPPGLRCLADVNCGPVASGYCWIRSKEFKDAKTHAAGQSPSSSSLSSSSSKEVVAWGRCVCEGGFILRRIEQGDAVVMFCDFAGPEPSMHCLF